MEHANCKCGLTYQDTDMMKIPAASLYGVQMQEVGSLKETINRIFGINTYQPKRILKNGVATIVFWEDGTKTEIQKGKE